MRILQRVLILILCLAGLSCDNTDTMRLTGTVKNGLTNSGIAGAKVVLETGNGDYIHFELSGGKASGTTKSDGTYDVALEIDEDIPHDEVRLTVSAEGLGKYITVLPFADLDDYEVVLGD